MAITATPGYSSKAKQLPSMEAALRLTTPKVGAYNPYAYVPGGSSPTVSQAIQAAGYAVPKVTIPSASTIVQPTAAPAAASTLASTGGGGSSGAGLDEYLSEARNDPMWQLADRNYADAVSMGERSTFGDPFRQALVQYGYVPSEAQINALSPDLQAMVRKYLDPAAVQAAQDNPYSTAAQISHSFDQALAGLAPTAAMHGTLGGGGQAIAASNLGYQRGKQASDTMNQFLSAIGTANQNFVNLQSQQADIRRQAQEDVASRLAQIAGYHALLDAQGNAVADTGGVVNTGGNSPYDGMPDIGLSYDQLTATTPAEVAAADQAAGQWDSWANAMGNLGSGSTLPAGAILAPKPPKVLNATQKTIQKVRAKGAK